MIITGKCKVCGSQIGLKSAELGKRPPPTLCASCDREAKSVTDLFGTLKDIATGGKPEGME